MITKRTDVTINENIKTLFEMLVSSGEYKNHHVINATTKNNKIHKIYFNINFDDFKDIFKITV